MAYLKSVESALSFVKARGRARESHRLSRPVALNSIRIHSWGYLEDEEYLETKPTSWPTCTWPAPPGLDAEAQVALKTQPALCGPEPSWGTGEGAEEGARSLHHGGWPSRPQETEPQVPRILG